MEYNYLSEGVREPTARKSITLQKNSVTCASPFGNDEYICIGLGSGVINLVPVGDKKLIKLIGHKDTVTCLETCPFHRYIASGSNDGNVRLWVANEAGDSMAIRIDGSPVRSIGISNSFDKLFAVTSQRSPSLWDPQRCQKILNLPDIDSVINSCSLSTDGLISLTGSEDGYFRMYDLRSGIVTKETYVGSSVTSTAIRQTGTLIAAGLDNGVVLLWDTRTHATINNDPLHHGSVTSCHFHPTKSLLLTASEDTNIGVCNADSRSLYFTLKCHSGPVSYVRWSADGSTFTSSGEDRRVVLWDEPNVEGIKEPEQPKIVRKRKIEKLDNFNRTIPEPPEELPKPSIDAAPQVKVEDLNMKHYVSMMHKITDHIVTLSKTMSNLEAQLNVMDEQIAILESEKRKQAKLALRSAV